MELFVLVPIFIAVVSATIFATIAYQVIRGFAEWSRNNSMSQEAVPARVVSKRTETRGHGHTHGHGHGRVWTGYFTTFELKSGERMEFGLYGRDFGLLVEGDEGTLAFQGTRYLGFQRRM